MAKQHLEWPVIGIDLGTTYSSVAVWQHGRDHVEIIRNELGNLATPSVVGFRDNQRTIGEAAVNQAILNPHNTIYGAKRIIGRRFDDVVIQEDILVLPFNVINGDSSGKPNKPLIAVNSNSVAKIFYPEEVCAMTLSKMKRVAEDFLRCPVKNAVVSVPAYFNNYQRQATKDAGTIAGFDEVHIMNEPTAAAMAYTFNMKINESNKGKKNVLVFDLGGGTFDVSLVAIENNKIKVISTNGDTHLGGVDFNNKMVVQLVKEFEQKHQMDISKNPKALARLRVASEKAKTAMSLTQQTDIEIDSIIDGYDFSTTITRADFERWNEDLFRKCMVKVAQCLEDARLLKSDVDDVVLVGGSSRLLKVREMLKNYFDGKEPCASVLPEEVVVIGAALRGAILSGFRSSYLDIAVEDVAPISLGTDIANQIISLIMPRNTTIPAKVIHSYQTIDPVHTSCIFKVCEGEEPYLYNNLLVDEYTLLWLPRTLNRAFQFNICFDIDMDGILNVTANSIQGRSEQISVVKNSFGLGLTSDEISSMIEVAKAYNTQDENQRKLTLAKTNLESYANKVWEQLESDEKIFKIDKKKKASMEKIRKDITDTLQWLQGDMNRIDIFNFENKLRQLQIAYSNYNRTLRPKGSQTAGSSCHR